MSKKSKNFFSKELKTLARDFKYSFMMNLFKGEPPHNAEEHALHWLEHHEARKWGWKLASILDLHLQGIEEWDRLSAEEREILAKEVIKLLEKGMKK